MSTTDADSLTVFSDYVCPFCYLGKAAMASYLEDAADPPTVEWHAFDLRGAERDATGELPDDSDAGMDDDQFAEIAENVRRLADEYDVDMARIDSRDVDSWNAQKLGLSLKRAERDRDDDAFAARDDDAFAARDDDAFAARDDDAFAAFHERTFDALWQDGRDIGDVEVLVDIATDVGIPEDEVRSAIQDDALDQELRARFETAREMGVTGIPTFAYDGHAARGAIPPAQFERLIDGT